jgi:hypothetical protein
VVRNLAFIATALSPRFQVLLCGPLPALSQSKGVLCVKAFTAFQRVEIAASLTLLAKTSVF